MIRREPAANGSQHPEGLRREVAGKCEPVNPNMSLGLGNELTFHTPIRHVPFRPEPNLVTRSAECPLRARSERWFFDVAAVQKIECRSVTRSQECPRSQAKSL